MVKSIKDNNITGVICQPDIGSKWQAHSLHHLIHQRTQSMSILLKMKQLSPLSPILFNIIFELLSRPIRQMKVIR